MNCKNCYNAAPGICQRLPTPIMRANQVNLTKTRQCDWFEPIPYDQTDIRLKDEANHELQFGGQPNDGFFNAAYPWFEDIVDYEDNDFDNWLSHIIAIAD